MENRQAQYRSLQRFRIISLSEGISFLMLVIIAMPLKYLADWPLGVKYVGWLHGLLFMLYIVQLIIVADKLKWKIARILIAFIASLVPFGPFLLEKRLKPESEALMSED